MSFEWRSIKNLNLFAQWEKVNFENLVPLTLYPQFGYFRVRYHLLCWSDYRRFQFFIKPRFADISLRKNSSIFYICFGAISVKYYLILFTLIRTNWQMCHCTYINLPPLKWYVQIWLNLYFSHILSNSVNEQHVRSCKNSQVFDEWDCQSCKFRWKFAKQLFMFYISRAFNLTVIEFMYVCLFYSYWNDKHAIKSSFFK